MAAVAVSCVLGGGACRDGASAARSASSSSAASASSAPPPIVQRDAASADAGPVADPCRVTGFRKPLLARWTAAERGALEVAMRAGIAVVSADDCRGMRLLPGCHARGRYGYLEAAPRSHAVDLSTDEELRVNAPLAGTEGAPEKLPVHVAVTIVGERATTRGLLSPPELAGDCAGATHFVTSASVGAVEIASGAAPTPRTANDPCAAGSTDGGPPAACSSLVEIGVAPIAELGDLITFDRAPKGTVAAIGACPADMVVSALRCVRPPVAAPYLCAFGDLTGCRRQCDGGDVNSCEVLGFMLWHGSGAPADPSAAEAIYARVCERDHERLACANVAVMHGRGEGVPKDPAKAARFYELSCRLGDRTACGNLGVAYLSGEGVAADASRGTSILERTCDSGGANACEQLARAVFDKDPARALAILDDLCDGDDGTACRSLGVEHYRGRGRVPADRPRAARDFEKACATGADDACVTAALMYRQADGVARDDRRATQLVEYACGHGHADGCFNLGIAYENGKGVGRSGRRAAELYEQACAAKVARACMFLADLTGDVKSAGDLYRSACELGEAEACRKQR
jgi:TPR repeat protein